MSQGKRDSQTPSARQARVDAHVGKRLHQLRTKHGLKQQAVAKDVLEISFQQLDRLEKGKRTLKSGQMYRLCQYFNVDMSYFFDGLDENGESPVDEDDDPEPGPSRQALEIAHSIDKLDGTTRDRFHFLIRHLDKSPIDTNITRGVARPKKKNKG